MKRRYMPSELIFMVLIFVTATRTNEVHASLDQPCATRSTANASTVPCLYCLASHGYRLLLNRRTAVRTPLTLL